MINAKVEGTKRPSPIHNEAELEQLVEERDTEVANNNYVDLQHFDKVEERETEIANVNDVEETRMCVSRKEFEAWVRGKYMNKNTATKYGRTLEQIVKVVETQDNI